jgi:hypothetical protein
MFLVSGAHCCRKELTSSSHPLLCTSKTDVGLMRAGTLICLMLYSTNLLGTGITLAILIYNSQLMSLLGNIVDKTSFSAALNIHDYKLCTLWTCHICVHVYKNVTFCFL